MLFGLGMPSGPCPLPKMLTGHRSTYVITVEWHLTLPNSKLDWTHSLPPGFLSMVLLRNVAICSSWSLGSASGPSECHSIGSRSRWQAIGRSHGPCWTFSWAKAGGFLGKIWHPWSYRILCSWYTPEKMEEWSFRKLNTIDSTDKDKACPVCPMYPCQLCSPVALIFLFYFISTTWAPPNFIKLPSDIPGSPSSARMPKQTM